MYNVKIIGAGSIGNHLAQASRRMGWDVSICDTDPAALKRTQNEIYPARYGAWDDRINLFTLDEVPKGKFDFIIIGTPPDSHFRLAIDILKNESAKGMLIEKPLCKPDLEDAEELFELIRESNIRVFTGYDHILGPASRKVAELVNSHDFGIPLTLDVEFREHWGGIFNAHPWLNGPQDTYLGYWKRGGGALGEHSHALNLWQYFAEITGSGKIDQITANLKYIEDGKAVYDQLALLNLKTDHDMVGRVVQDVVTRPTRKWARIQWENSSIEWLANYKPNTELVVFNDRDQEQSFEFEKKRPDDFFIELTHIHDCLENDNPSPISFEKGLETMLAIAGAHESAKARKTVSISYDKGWSVNAVNSGA